MIQVLDFCQWPFFFHIFRLESVSLGTSKSAAKQHCILVLFLLSAFQTREIELQFNIGAKDIGINQRHIFSNSIWPILHRDSERFGETLKKISSHKNTLSFVSADQLHVYILGKVKT